jgi:hypothetical protein
VFAVAGEPRAAYSSPAVTGILHRAETGAPNPGPVAAVPPPLAVSPALLRRVPHLPAFFPDRVVFALGDAPPGAAPLVLDGEGETPDRAGAGALRATEGLWRAPAFGRRRAPVGLVLRDGAPPAAPDPAGTASVMAMLREARVGGAPGLPDPGPAGHGLPRRRAVLVVDPCAPGAAPGGASDVGRGARGAGGRPVLLAADPAAPRGAPGAARRRGASAAGAAGALDPVRLGGGTARARPRQRPRPARPRRLGRRRARPRRRGPPARRSGLRRAARRDALGRSVPALGPGRRRGPSPSSPIGASRKRRTGASFPASASSGSSTAA